MDSLITVVNKLHTAFSNVGVEASIDLPSLVVVGSQSTGKSSVLEHIVGHDFLPRGSDIVTRRPLLLKLINISKNVDGSDPVPFAEFGHQPDQILQNFDEIRQEIERETIKLAGDNKNIRPEPISLSIHSSKVLNLTLVDLPGLTKVAVGDQPKDIEDQTRKLVLSYINNPNAIILAVSSANVDLANSEALKIAKEVDPQGLRTIGILTKVDLMDQGTNALDMINGKIVPLKLGYIPVVNRSQKDIQSNKRITEALKAEKEFFANHHAYSSIASRCGTPYLAKTLNGLLMEHIQNRLPDLKKRILQLNLETQQRYARIGGNDENSFQNFGAILLNMIKEYSNTFDEKIEGKNIDVNNELTGGAYIYQIFSAQFYSSMLNVDPFQKLSYQEIRIAIRNSKGIRGSLYFSERAFHNLLKLGIANLLDPCLQCVEKVALELQNIIDKLKITELSRFPQLSKRVRETSLKLIKESKGSAITMVTNLVEMERAYIKTDHPDFRRVVLEMINQPNHSPNQTPKLEVPKQKPLASTGIAEIIPNDSLVRTPISNEEERQIEVTQQLIHQYFNLVKKSLLSTVPKVIVYCLVNGVNQGLQNRLLQDLYKESEFEDLQEEDKDMKAERLKCRTLLGALKKASEILGSI